MAVRLASVLLLFVLGAVMLATAAATQAESVENATLPFQIVFNPAKMLEQVPMGGQRSVEVFFKKDSSNTAKYVLGIRVKNDEKASITDPVLPLTSIDELPDVNITDSANITASGNFTVQGVFLGYSELIFYVCDSNKNICNDTTTFPNVDGTAKEGSSIWTTLDIKYRMSVMRPRTVLDDVFVVAVSALVFISQIAVGCKTKISVIKEVLKRPIAPVIGFCCQFCLMPPLAFGVGKLIPVGPGEALGIFAIGCSPGGGSSNMYTYLLQGDVSLSITMTMISTFASLGMTPLWMYTLGQLLLEELGMGNVSIPFENIVLSLVTVIVPVGIGLIIKKKAPTVAKKIAVIIRPFMFLFLLFMFTFGIYVNYYMFKLFNSWVVIAGLLFPLCGFLGGAAIAAICRQPWKWIKTIALETGIQNSGVAILMMLFSLPSPDAELAVVGSIAVTMFTPAYPLILVLVYEIRRRCCMKKSEKEEDAEKDEIDAEKDEIDAEKDEIDTEKDEIDTEKDEIDTEKAKEPKEKPKLGHMFVAAIKNYFSCKDLKDTDDTAEGKEKVDVDKSNREGDKATGDETIDEKDALNGAVSANGHAVHEGDVNLGFKNDMAEDTKL